LFKKTIFIRRRYLLFLFLLNTGVLAFSQDMIQGEMSGWGQELLEPPSFLYMYEELDGMVGNRTLIDVLIISSEGKFSFQRPSKSTRVYEFEAPPWSWKVLVRPDEIELDTLTLLKPSKGPTRLRRVMAKSNWGLGHPALKYDSLRMLASELDALVMFDRMALSGAIGSGGRLVNSNYTDSIDFIFEEACTKLLSDIDFMNSPNYIDLVFALRLQWKRDSGLSSDMLREVWQKQSQVDTMRTILEKVQSPGWCSSWIEVNMNWYKEVAEAKDLVSWINTNNSDSIALSLGCTVDEVAVAMWWWEIAEPNSIASLWWSNNTDTPISSLRLFNGPEKWSSIDLVNQIWTTPSLDLVSVDELYGKWSVILVVKSGSSASMREWSAFRAIESSLQSSHIDIQFMVLSVDGTQLEWDVLLGSRQSSTDFLRWVGADTRWLDGLSIVSTPQVIILTPNLEVHSLSNRLPSQGLLKVLTKLR
jgi:hypothetical protein